MDKALYLQKEYNNDYARPYSEHHRIRCYIRCHHGRDDVCCTLVHLRMRRQDGVDASPRSPNFLDRDGVGRRAYSLLLFPLLVSLSVGILSYLWNRYFATIMKMPITLAVVVVRSTLSTMSFSAISPNPTKYTAANTTNR